MSDEAKREIADECMLQYNSVATQLTKRVLLSRPEDPIAFIMELVAKMTQTVHMCVCVWRVRRRCLMRCCATGCGRGSTRTRSVGHY